MNASDALDLTSIKSALAQLVAFDTQNPPGRELEAAQWLKVAMSEMGFTADTTDVMPGRTNVVGVLANGPGAAFAFNTHIDVVPAGAGWTSNPLALRESSGR